jgi:hypothetical protein
VLRGPVSEKQGSGAKLHPEPGRRAMRRESKGCPIGITGQLALLRSAVSEKQG